MRTKSSPPARTNESLSEANCVNMPVMGDSWDKKPEDWVRKCRLSTLGQRSPKGAENESVEQLSSAGRIVVNKCELLFTGRFPTEITHGENCLDVEKKQCAKTKCKKTTTINAKPCNNKTF